MRDVGTVILVVIVLYFALSIFTDLIPGPLAELPRQLYSGVVQVLRMIAQAVGLPPEYIMLLQFSPH